MIFRALSVMAYMFRAMIEYVFRKAFSPKSVDRALEADYLGWARHALRVFDADLVVEGREHLPPADGRRVIVVSNHQSQLDIPALVASLERRVGFVAKKELGSIPLLNYWMKEVGCIFIDRSDRRGANLALENAAKAMGTHPLVVFPEGTRSKTGDLLPIKLGGFRLALLARARVVPVLIEGTRDAVENRVKGSSKPIPVKVRIFPTLDTEGMADGKPSLQRIKDYVDACWRSGAPQAQAPAPAAVADAPPR